MIDLHLHSAFSDGELIPSEIIRRMSQIGNEGLAITDHADFSNVGWILGNLRKMKDFRDDYELNVLFGVELTHVPPKLMGRAVELARKEGAEIIVVHGESIAEPVKAGTNMAAVQEEIDILAHPGLIGEETAQLAASNGVFLEISARRGHSLTNGHVAMVAQEEGCELVINTDSHSPSDFITTERARSILQGAGVAENDVKKTFDNSERLLKQRL
ncbi:MAG: histidinol phosphate phosphatase domain-containing protein [Archaeoglobaceae archaeon]